jgi:ABC-type multidrug transport system fused ATPase/permease subunit
MKSSWRFYHHIFQRYLRPQAGKLFLLAVLLLISSSVALAPAKVLQIYIDAAQRKSILLVLLLAAACYLGCVVLSMVVNVWSTVLSEKLSWIATNRLRIDLMQHYLDLDMSFHNAHTPGEIIERIDGDISNLSNFFSQMVLNIINNVLLLIGTLVLLSFTDWRLGLMFSLFALVTLFAMGKVRHIAIPHWKVARQASAQFFGFLEERLMGREDIRSSAAGSYVLHRFYHLLKERFRLERKAGVMGSTLGATAVVCFTFGYIFAFAFGAYFYQRGMITLGGVYLFYQYVVLLERPFQQITTQLDDFQLANASLLRVWELLQTQSMLVEGKDGTFSPGPLSVAFRNVTFGYFQEQATLKNISLTLEAGKVLAVIGRTGSGKSTLARLLLRLYDPTSGEILLGGTPLTSVPLQKVRQSVGLVTQDIQFFHASVRDNLTFFDRSISDETIVNILRDVGLDGWYQSLPHGLDTLLQGSQGLSAGEAQLLAFTRVFLKDPQVVILDEASSRLDPITEQNIEQAVDCLFSNRTGIIIAHRLTTIERADQILVLNDGEIEEFGERVALLQNEHTHVAQLFAHLKEVSLA